MIKAKNSKVTLKGRPFELVKEYGHITSAMIEMLKDDGFEKEGAKELLTKIVETKFMTQEEKEEALKQEINKLFEDMTDVLGKILSKEEKEGADNE